VSGDLVKLPGCQDLFIVSQRIWDLKSGTATLQLVFDVLVRDHYCPVKSRKNSTG
jgi:hypothetical protein